MRRRRNTAAFTGMAYASFILSLGFILAALYNADWPLVEKGYYAACTFWVIMSAIVLQKVVRDNEEDKEASMYTEDRNRSSDR